MEEFELINIEVGQPFPLYNNSIKRLKGIDGAFFEANDSNQGYNFCIHLTNISYMDTHIFRNDKIQMRVLQGSDGLVLPMIKFGKSMMFEMNFNPNLYDDDRALQITDTNNILNLFLIESNNGVLKAIRQCNFPLKMIQICKEAWSRAILDPEYNIKYGEWLKRTSNYALQTLWDRATKVGAMGETYDLRDIRVPNQYQPNFDELK